tara:strand:+ start:84 stop:944 length:861 start_codon:yes stop_codon:yes gene_type:complete
MKITRKRKYKEKHREFLKEQVSVFLKSNKEIKKDVKVKKESYQKYLKSVNWEARKQTYYDRFIISFCEVCQAKENLQVHHNNYVRARQGHLGAEDDSHLVVLCGPCHVLFHQHSKPISHVVCERSGFGKYSPLEPVRKCCKLCGRKAKYDVKSRPSGYKQTCNERFDKYQEYISSRNEIREEKSRKLNALRNDASYVSMSLIERKNAKEKIIEAHPEPKRIEAPERRRGIYMCGPCTLIFQEQLNQNNNGKGTLGRDLTTQTPVVFKKQVRKPTVIRRRKSRKLPS